MWLQLTRILVAWLSLGLIASAQELRLDRDAVIRAKEYEPYLLDASAKYGLDSRLLWTIAYLETRFDHRHRSESGVLIKKWVHNFSRHTSPFRFPTS